jgi:hypothetical protein
MKFTVNRIALERMVGQLKIEPGVKGPQQRMVRLSACAARVFVEANGVTAGIEALVLEDGACNVPRMKFLKVLRTFHPKQNITLAADASGLRIVSFTMKATSYSPAAVPPGEFQVFPVTDLAALFPDKATQAVKTAPVSEAAPPPESPGAYLESGAKRLPIPDAPPGLKPTPTLKHALAWEFFAPEILERLFMVYMHKNELPWAERMWAALATRGLTAYSTATEYNLVLVRLAVLARYFKCWVWQAYGGCGDPEEEYEDWFEVLPFVRSALPPSKAKEGAGKPQESSETTRDLLHRMLRVENDAVFEAVIVSCGDGGEIYLALDLRHAAGIGDNFLTHTSFCEHEHDVADQEAHFNEYGLSMKESDCVSIMIGNRFCF